MPQRQTNTIELKKIMIERGLETISDLSNATGINRNTLGKVLKGIIQPSADVMNKLVMVLNVSPARAGEIFFNVNLRDAQVFNGTQKADI